MAKAKWLTYDQEVIIASASVQIKPRKVIISEIKEELKRNGLSVPKDNTLLKEISFYRHHSPANQDTKWTLGSLAQYELPADAVPLVFQASSKTLLTIREANWMGRLYRLFTNQSELLKESKKLAEDEVMCIRDKYRRRRAK